MVCDRYLHFVAIGRYEYGSSSLSTLCMAITNEKVLTAATSHLQSFVMITAIFMSGIRACLLCDHLSIAARLFLSQGADILVLSEYAIIKLLSRAQLIRYAAELPSVDDVIVPCVDLTQHEVRTEPEDSAGKQETI